MVIKDGRQRCDICEETMKNMKEEIKTMATDCACDLGVDCGCNCGKPEKTLVEDLRYSTESPYSLKKKETLTESLKKCIIAGKAVSDARNVEDNALIEYARAILNYYDAWDD